MNLISCNCGCGELINKYDKRGRLRRFVKYHQLKNMFTEEVRGKISKALKGREFSEEWKNKLSESKKGEKNNNWKWNNLKYGGLHKRIKQQIRKSDFCQICNKVPPVDLANISGKYLLDLSDWQWLCRSCHIKSDGRLGNLKQYKK